MLFYIMAFSSTVGLIGIYIGLYVYRKYTDIVYSVEPIPISHILKLSVLTGVSTCFSFFAVISVFGTITDRNYDWSLQGLFAVLGVSTVLGIFVFWDLYIKFIQLLNLGVCYYAKKLSRKEIDSCHLGLQSIQFPLVKKLCGFIPHSVV